MIERFCAWRQGLHVRYFDGWHPLLDEALSVLPEMEICPHELFRLLVRNPSPSRKRVALITERGEPVAVAGIRKKLTHWEPVTTWILPGVLFPMRSEAVGRILPALGVNLHVAWWRWDDPPPLTKWTKDITKTPRYGFRCSDDFEAYWRENGHYKNIRLRRNRCREMSFKIDLKGMTEWTIKQWGEKWSSGRYGEIDDIADRILAALYLQERGAYHTLTLFDGDNPVASVTALTHRNDAVAQYNYRDSRYDWHSPMTRLLELFFYWSRDMGFQRVDIGGKEEYKRHWAPPYGERWEFRIYPEHLLVRERVGGILHQLKNVMFLK